MMHVLYKMMNSYIDFKIICIYAINIVYIIHSYICTYNDHGIIYLHFIDYEWEDLMHGQDLQSLGQDSCHRILIVLVKEYSPSNCYQI